MHFTDNTLATLALPSAPGSNSLGHVQQETSSFLLPLPSHSELISLGSSSSPVQLVRISTDRVVGIGFCGVIGLPSTGWEDVFVSFIPK